MVCPPNCRMATSKLTRVLNEGFSNMRANTFLSSRESQPSAFISIAPDISNLISPLVRSVIESKSFLIKPTLRVKVSSILYSISRKNIYSIEGVINSLQQELSLTEWWFLSLN